MSETAIVSQVRAALAQMIIEGTVREIRVAETEDQPGSNGSTGPALVIHVFGENPQSHCAEIHRLIKAEGLAVRWKVQRA